MQYVFFIVATFFAASVYAGHSPSPFYELGASQGKTTADASWDNLQPDACKELHAYSTIIRDSLHAFPGNGSEEFNNGYRDALSEALRDHFASCNVKISEPPSVDLPHQKLKIPPPTQKGVVKFQSSYYRLGYNVAYAQVITVWDNLQGTPDSKLSFLKAIEEMLEAERKAEKEGKAHSTDALHNHLQGFVAGVRAALSEVANKCGCDVKIYRQFVDDWEKKSEQPAIASPENKAVN